MSTWVGGLSLGLGFLGACLGILGLSLIEECIRSKYPNLWPEASLGVKLNGVVSDITKPMDELRESLRTSFSNAETTLQGAVTKITPEAVQAVRQAAHTTLSGAINTVQETAKEHVSQAIDEVREAVKTNVLETLKGTIKKDFTEAISAIQETIKEDLTKAMSTMQEAARTNLSNLKDEIESDLGTLKEEERGSTNARMRQTTLDEWLV